MRTHVDGESVFRLIELFQMMKDLGTSQTDGCWSVSQRLYLQLTKMKMILMIASACLPQQGGLHLEVEEEFDFSVAKEGLVA